MHSVATSAANVSDVHMLPDLLHGEERKVMGRRLLSGTDQGHPAGRAEGSGHDLQEDVVQELCG